MLQDALKGLAASNAGALLGDVSAGKDIAIVRNLLSVQVSVGGTLGYLLTGWINRKIGFGEDITFVLQVLVAFYNGYSATSDKFKMAVAK